MHILSFTTLYPYPKRPRHGIFVENRLKALVSLGHNIKTVAPVPWFPLSAEFFGDYSRYACPPAREERFGIDIRHPQYLLVPKLGLRATVGRLEQVFERALDEVMAEGFVPDVIDAHYLYPDGVAAVRVATRRGIPAVLTARGSDVTLLPSYPAPRRMILEAVSRADHVITVAEALRQDLIELGADPTKVTTVRNGVDTTLFRPDVPPDPLMARQDGITCLLSVGHLIPRKGHHLAIDAVAQLPDTRLVIVGGGPEEPALRRHAERLRLGDRVIFAGEQPHDALPAFYAGADCLVLASDREGWPNVLLEAMACGTRCIATPAGGVAEVITAPEAGIVTGDRSADAVAEAVRTLKAAPDSRNKTRLYAEQFDWHSVAKDVETIWTRAKNRGSRTGWGTPAPIPAERPAKAEYLFTVDTEEIFDWNGDPLDWRLPPLEWLERLQQTAEDTGTVPLYFVTAPLLADEALGGALARWTRAGKAACGLHLHSWSTPPVPAHVTPAETYQFNLDPDLHRQKLENIIRLFEERIGQKPIAHRAGRYGIAPWVLDQLAEYGVMLDFSPSAGWSFLQVQGPDFAAMPPDPRKRETPHGGQWVIPVSGSRVVRKVDIPAPLSPSLYGWARYLAHEYTAPVRLTPEGNDLGAMQKLTRHLIGRGAALLTPSIHSTSPCPGATPYAATEEEAKALLGTLKAYFEWAQGEGIAATTLKGVADRFGVKMPIKATEPA